MAVPFDSEVKVPKPYIRWNERAAIVVAANRNSGQDANLTLRVPLQEIGFSGHSSYRVTDLGPRRRHTCIRKATSRTWHAW